MGVGAHPVRVRRGEGLPAGRRGRGLDAAGGARGVPAGGLGRDRQPAGPPRQGVAERVRDGGDVLRRPTAPPAGARGPGHGAARGDERDRSVERGRHRRDVARAARPFHAGLPSGPAGPGGRLRWRLGRVGHGRGGRPGGPRDRARRDDASGPAKWLGGVDATGGLVRFRAEAGRRYLVASRRGVARASGRESRGRDPAGRGEPGRLPPDRPGALPRGGTAARGTAAQPGTRGHGGVARGDRRAVRSRRGLGGGDPRVRRSGLPGLEAALAALRGPARRLVDGPAELHGRLRRLRRFPRCGRRRPTCGR